MNPKLTPRLPMTVLAVLALAMVAPLASAATFTPQAVPSAGFTATLAKDAAPTTAEVTRSFTYDATAEVTASVPAATKDPQLSKSGYNMQVYLSADNGTTYTLIDDAEDDIAITPSSAAKVKVVYTVPAAGSRVVGLFDAIVKVTSKGTTVTSFETTFGLCINDPVSDTDADCLKDTWEDEHFDTKTAQNARGDPDADTYSNYLEFRGRSDPNDISSQPEHSVGGVAGVQVTDRDIGAMILGGLVFILVAYAAVLAVKNGAKDDNVGGGILIGGLVVLAGLGSLRALEKVEFLGPGWTFWSHLNLTLLEGSFITLAFAIPLLMGVGVMMFNKGRPDMPVAVRFGLAAVVTALAAWVTVFYVDIGALI